jgi:xeroderma pigmentosum group C-complementing protein
MLVVSVSPRKRTLFDALDTPNSQSTASPRDLLINLAGHEDDESSELSSLSSSELEFEDVPSEKGHKIQDSTASGDEGEGEEDGIEFEDVHTSAVHAPTTNVAPSGDLELTLRKETRISLTNPHNKKQGPSKIERQIRIATHCMHVQFLMFHNALRNSWICDSEVQDILVKGLGSNIQAEIQRWRVDSGLASNEDSKDPIPKHDKRIKGTNINERNQRDWGEPAQRIATSSVNMSQGDPLFRLLKYLIAYWTKRFRITAPGLRKLGYMPLQVLDEEIKHFNKGEYDQDRHGERICGIGEFRARAKTCEGSRDLSAQLFTALLRGIGLEARMVASLQPVGFSWSKHEDASPKRLKRSSNTDAEKENENSGEQARDVKPRSPANSKGKRKKAAMKSVSKKSTQRNPRVDDFNDMLGDLSDLEADFTDNDYSVIDVTPSQARKEVSKPYERDLPPNYWTEVLSPVTNTYVAVNPLNLNNPAATNPDLLALFEPRGVKSEKAKQVMAYIVGYSSDGTAKDVTVRYLRRHMFPGKTKGFRMPIERIPVFNKQGKVKHYEEFDWFKTVMGGYRRRGKARTEIDEYEEAMDLKAAKPEKKEVKEGEETLQSYKASTEFVLERHLHREEAILPRAQHVKTFIVKGRKGEEPVEEKVFLRKDVVSCKSVETWHKEGREPKLGEQPLKLVPYRAATTNRKRELAEAEAITGEKILQGLYSRDQTDWIIPPPIVDGKIPKNAYGNMDVFVPSMVPLGAVHLPHRGTKRICQKLGVDFAEAVTGFEFGARMAIPVITGVVVAAESEELILDQWEQDEAERVRKEDEKRRAAALGKWRKFLMGLRVIERVREEYGEELDDNVDELNPWINKNSKKVDSAKNHIDNHRDDDSAGGFLLPNEGEENLTSSFFPMRHEGEDDGDEEGGGFIT